jgi:hypothetical protein
MSASSDPVAKEGYKVGGRFCVVISTVQAKDQTSFVPVRV